MLIFVDANVLVYAHDSNAPVKSLRAREWLTRLWRERTGRTSIQVLNEYYHNVTRKLRPGLPSDAAWEDVTTYFAWRPLPIDETLIRRAREVERRHQLSWWDSMVVAAAQLQDCVVLLTEDLQEGMTFGTLAVRSPFSSVLEEPPAEYAVARAHPLHRPRGRPRRASLQP